MQWEKLHFDSWLSFKLNNGGCSTTALFVFGLPGKVRQCPVTGNPSATHLVPRARGRRRSEWAVATAASSSCPPGCGGRGTPRGHLLRTQEEWPSSPRLRVTRRQAHAPCWLSHAPAAASSGSEEGKKRENRSPLWGPAALPCSF